jgi:hypothetical protein
MLCVPGSCSKFPVNKNPEYPLMHRVCFLAPVLRPQFLSQKKLLAFQFPYLCHHDLNSLPL